MKTYNSKKSAFLSAIIFSISLYFAKNGNSFVQNNAFVFIAFSVLSLLFICVGLLNLAVISLFSSLVSFAIFAAIETIYSALYQKSKLPTFFYINN